MRGGKSFFELFGCSGTAHAGYELGKSLRRRVCRGGYSGVGTGGRFGMRVTGGGKGA